MSSPEIPAQRSGRHSIIIGVPTSVAAFVGHACSGAVNTPIRIANFAEFEREFSGGSEVSCQVGQFFRNGGASAWISSVAGGAEQRPAATELIGEPSQHTGIYALDNVDLFNLLVLPDLRNMSVADNARTIAAAAAYCKQRRAFLIADIPKTVATPADVRDWMAFDGLANENTAAYFPEPLVPDPADSTRLRAIGASGTLAGIYARTDTDRGVWATPTGTDATLHGVAELSYRMDDQESELLEQAGINPLRVLPVYGNVAWGARTLHRAGVQPEWKYVPVRRLALFLQESLWRGLQWAVFEPNNEVLWSLLRLEVGAFLHSLFDQGAFAGQTPRDAYFVRCDSSTTSQSDIDQGLVNVVIGFAPLRPAEFVVVTITQLTGQGPGS